MKAIRAPEEPGCFSTWRTTNPTATWEMFKDANRRSGDTPGCAHEVLSVLIEAQQGLCAFCEIDLEPPLWSQVEHWHPKDPAKSDGKNWGLDFANLMAGCEGGVLAQPERGRSLPPIKSTQHCGQAKGNHVWVDVLLDPRWDVPITPSLWAFDGTGEMRVDDEQAGAQAERAQRTITLLNLNSRVLCRLRAAVWDELNNDVLAVWTELGGDEEHYISAYRTVAQERLAQRDGRLRRFWSTARAFLGEAAEEWIQVNMMSQVVSR